MHRTWAAVWHLQIEVLGDIIGIGVQLFVTRECKGLIEYVEITSDLQLHSRLKRGFLGLSLRVFLMMMENRRFAYR